MSYSEYSGHTIFGTYEINDSKINNLHELLDKNCDNLK